MYYRSCPRNCCAMWVEQTLRGVVCILSRRLSSLVLFGLSQGSSHGPGHLYAACKGLQGAVCIPSRRLSSLVLLEFSQGSSHWPIHLYVCGVQGLFGVLSLIPPGGLLLSGLAFGSLDLSTLWGFGEAFGALGWAVVRKICHSRESFGLRGWAFVHRILHCYVPSQDWALVHCFRCCHHHGCLCGIGCWAGCVTAIIAASGALARYPSRASLGRPSVSSGWGALWVSDPPHGFWVSYGQCLVYGCCFGLDLCSACFSARTP